VLVRCYHGLGDTIQFVRFAKPLRLLAREVILWVQPELVELLRHVEGVDRLLVLSDGVPDCTYDVDIEIMELPHALRATATLISCAPYIPQYSFRRFRSGDSISIGLIWESGQWDRNRSVPPQLFNRLSSQSGVRLFSLQQGPARKAAAIIPATDIAREDLVSLARTMMDLDLIITVDTMAAHLAGALGATVWTMLHANCDWRWSKTEHSIWYPGMKLFHQQKPGDWSDVIEEIADELHHFRRQQLPGCTKRAE
jgi:hypothetical protein